MSATRKVNNDNIDDKLHCDELKRACDVASAASAVASRGSPLEGASAAIGGEEEPAMRSVALPAHRRVLHFEPVLKRVEASPLTKQKPVSFASYPSPADHAEIFRSDQPAKPAFPSDASVKAPAKKWFVKSSNLTPRPADSPLERTSRIVSGSTAEDIADRITTCLQTRSIKAKFSKTEVLAKCRNTSFVKFYIRLYSEREGVLVEVQKMYGETMAFMRDSRAILDCAEGKPASNPEEETPLFLDLPVSQMEFVKNVTLPPLTVEEESESVNITAELLSSSRSDSNMLGMESLVSLTDPLKTLRSTAMIAAKRVLCSEDDANESFNMHNYVMSLVIHDNGSDDPSCLEGTAMEDFDLRLRHLALQSVSNAIALLQQEKVLWSTLGSSHNWYVDVLIPKLVQDLTRADERPHEACYASRCLLSLAVVSESKVFAFKIEEIGGVMALENAREVGTSEFALLAKDAGNCHQTILQCR